MTAFVTVALVLLLTAMSQGHTNPVALGPKWAMVMSYPFPPMESGSNWLSNPMLTNSHQNRMQPRNTKDARVLFENWLQDYRKWKPMEKRASKSGNVECQSPPFQQLNGNVFKKDAKTLEKLAMFFDSCILNNDGIRFRRR